MSASRDVLILGAGLAGCAAALWCRRLGLSFAWLEATGQVGGQLWRVHGVIPDYPGATYANGVAMAAALNEQLGAADLAPLLEHPVTAADLAAGELIAGETWRARTLVLATGAGPRTLGVPGEAVLAGRGVSTSATRDRELFAGKPVAVVGGGDAAFENALLLAEVGCRVTLLSRSARFRARPDFVARVAAEPRIEVLTEATVTAVEGAEHVTGVKLATPAGPRALAVEGVFVRVGVWPNTGLFAGQLALDGDGYVRVDADQRTTLPHVFAAGDVCSPIYSSLANAAGQGMVAAKAAARLLQA